MNAQISNHSPVYRQTPAAQLLGVADHIDLIPIEVAGSRRSPSIIYQTCEGKKSKTLTLKTSKFNRIDAGTARFNSEERCEKSGDVVTWYSDKHGNLAVFVQRHPGQSND